MKYLLLMLALSNPLAHAGAVVYNSDDYYIDYMTSDEKDKSLIIYENIKTGKVTKFVIPTKNFNDPEAIRAIKLKVVEENR